LAQENGVLLTKVNPAYTSQKCSLCGVIEKNNRQGEKYQCACGRVMDADLNAAINLSHMGVYSPHALY
jgi:putative transposase